MGFYGVVADGRGYRAGEALLAADFRQVRRFVLCWQRRGRSVILDQIPRMRYRTALKTHDISVSHIVGCV